MNLYPYNKNGAKISTDIAEIGLDRGFIARLQISASDAVPLDNAGVLEETALTSITQEITEGIINPAVPRNLTVIGNAAGITGDIAITGTNYADIIISETITLNGTTLVEGLKAFKTVSQIDLPIETNVGTDTISVGFGNKLGLPYKLAHDTVLNTYLNNAKEGTAPTVTVSTTAIESNTIKLNSALDGTVVDVYLIV